MNKCVFLREFFNKVYNKMCKSAKKCASYNNMYAKVVQVQHSQRNTPTYNISTSVKTIVKTTLKDEHRPTYNVIADIKTLVKTTLNGPM